MQPGPLARIEHLAASRSIPHAREEGSIMGIYIQETYAGDWEGESDIYDTELDDIGDVYRACRGRLGRCIGKMYVDLPDGTSPQRGWVFVRRLGDKRIETWVSVHTAPPTRQYHHYDFSRGLQVRTRLA